MDGTSCNCSHGRRTPVLANIASCVGVQKLLSSNSGCRRLGRKPLPDYGHLAIRTGPGSGLANQVLGPRAKMDCVLRGRGCHPASVVADATQAWRVLQRTLRQLGRSQAKRTLLHRLPATLVRPQMKANRWWTPKRDILGHIRKFPGYGIFLASAYWQLLRLRHPTYPTAQENTCAHLGPGARTGMNWLPFAKEPQDKHAADFFADQMCQLLSFFSRNSCLRPDAADTAIIRNAKDALIPHVGTANSSTRSFWLPTSAASENCVPAWDYRTPAKSVSTARVSRVPPVLFFEARGVFSFFFFRFFYSICFGLTRFSASPPSPGPSILVLVVRPHWGGPRLAFFPFFSSSVLAAPCSAQFHSLLLRLTPSKGWCRAFLLFGCLLRVFAVVDSG